MTAHNPPGALDEYIARYQHDPDYVAEGMDLEVAEQVVLLLEQKGMSRTALASAMGVSQAFVSRVLNAPPNLTLRSIAKLSLALGVRPVVHLVPIQAPPKEAGTSSHRGTRSREPREASEPLHVNGDNARRP